MVRQPERDTSTGRGDAGASRSANFGRYLHQIRTEVFKESLRDFSKRIGISASYIGKVENGEVGVPRRSTVIDIAKRLDLTPDPLLLKAGYIPDAPARSSEDEYLLMLLGTLTPAQREAVKAYIEHVRDFDITRTKD